MNAIAQPGLQTRTLRLYGELVCRGECWGGKLIFAAFDGAGASGLAAAASLAGAASLIADSDAANMKMHFRDGAFDFLVNTLDEALRAIKNEVRQGRPIAIGLIAEPSVVISEAVERGLAADVVLSGASEAVVADAAVVLTAEASSALTQWLSQKDWQEIELPADAPTALIAPDPVRQHWLRDLPTHQRSSRRGPRIVWMSKEELAGVQLAHVNSE